MQANQLSVKFFVADPARVDQTLLIPIFHRWIQEDRLPGRVLIDVADYRHVADGPGVVLIAHEAHYAMDSERGPLGLAVHRKRDEPGELADKVAEALEDALVACRALADEPSHPIEFRTDRVRVIVMSREFAPSTDETLAAARPALEQAAARVFPGKHVTVERVTEDPRGPFTVDLLLA